jgi:hypothetical protein
VTRLFWLLWDALVDDCDLDDWGMFIVLGIPLAGLFGAAIGLADVWP